MAFYTETEKRLRLLDQQRRALDRRRDTVTATAVDLVLHHGQKLDPTARRAGLTTHALRQAVHAHPEIAPILLGTPETPGAGT